MAQITDTDPYSNDYFFITGFSDVFYAGKNSFVVNFTQKVFVDQPITVRAYDVNNNVLPVSYITPPGSVGLKLTKFGQTYVVVVEEDTPNGVGRIEVSGKGSVGDIVWARNILIDTSRGSASAVNFFDLPYIDVTPELYNYTVYPNASYRMASGSCSSIAVSPRNNDSADFDYRTQKPIYQLFAEDNCNFSSSMEGEKIRIKNPYIKNFTYTNYSNNRITFEGVLNTDFIATVDKVVNNKTLILDIPFSTVADLVESSNQDSVYAKNNLVDIYGYNVNDDPAKQTMYKKRNFYILSIAKADYEVFYREIPDNVETTGSIIKSLLNVEFNNLRAYSGRVDSYKIYGRSMNSPEFKFLLCEGKAVGEELVATKNFKSGMYRNAGKFNSQNFLRRFWLTGSNNVTMTYSNTGYIDGAIISNASVAGDDDYVIFKDDTTGPSRSTAYVSYNLTNNSYWYAKSDAFINSAPIPSSSYDSIINIPALSGYSNSVENLINGAIYDSNPIHLRQFTLYKFSMNARPLSENTENSNIKIYFISGQDSKLIGTLDSSFLFGNDETFYATFFSDVDRFGTIKLVPSFGGWNISNISLKPYYSNDYSVDSFCAKVPLYPLGKNELYDIEAELYDGDGKLAYGEGSYSFKTNRLYRPLKKKIFIDPNGIASVRSGGGGGIAPIVIDGGGA